MRLGYCLTGALIGARLTGIFLVVSFSLALGACSTPTLKLPGVAPALQAHEEEKQLALVLHERLRSNARLDRIRYALALAAGRLCTTMDDAPPLTSAIGMRFANKHSFVKTEQDSAMRELKVGNALQVLQVIPGSAAARSGLQPADILVAVNGTPLPVGDDAPKYSADIFSSLQPGQEIVITVQRDGGLHDIALTTDSLCGGNLIRSSSAQINARTNGKQIIISEGMLRFAKDDTQLALVIGHEMAHNLLGHVPKTQINALTGAAIDLATTAAGVGIPGAFTFSGASLYSQAFEAEADYLALYLLADANYSLDETAAFWRRLAQTAPQYITAGRLRSHPSFAQRFQAMEATKREIDTKRATGDPLRPNQ